MKDFIDYDMNICNNISNGIIALIKIILILNTEKGFINTRMNGGDEECSFQNVENKKILD